MSDSPDVKRQNMHHMPMSCESPLEKRLSSMPPEELEPQNMSYLGKYNIQIFSYEFLMMAKSKKYSIFSQ